MQYKKGERVKHPARDDWGLGEVLEDAGGDSVRVFFVNAGQKTLSLNHVSLEKVSGEAAAHVALDNLMVPNEGGAIKYRSLPESIDFFLSWSPEGFYGDIYEEQEWADKHEAHMLGVELLGEQVFTELLAAGEFTEIAKRARRLVHKTNLPAPHEKIVLNDGLSDGEAQEKFAKALHFSLYGSASLEERFNALAAALEDIDAAKWPLVSYFYFILLPDEFMFVKPTVTQHVAELCGFDIQYRPQLNWLTYKLVLEFSQYLRGELAELKPRNMLDVQSFMWCIAPNSQY